MHAVWWLLWSLMIPLQGAGGPRVSAAVEPAVATKPALAVEPAVAVALPAASGDESRGEADGLSALRVPTGGSLGLGWAPPVALASAPAPLFTPVRSVSPLRERGSLSMPVDTPPPLPLVEYSDAYFTRLKIHRWASWAMVPLFAAQYASGQQLLDKGSAAPAWARNAHGPLAASVAGLFAVNTVTGVWNLWDARKDPAARGWRTAHGVLMLLADAGFAVTGALAEEAEGSGSRRTLHRDVALGSMATAAASLVMMLPPFRRD